MNDKTFHLKRNSLINWMIEILNKEWIIDYKENQEKEEVNLFDFMRYQILVNIIYLCSIYEIDLDKELLSNINYEIKSRYIEDYLVLSLSWKNKKIKFWKWINFKYWFDIDLEKERVYFRKNNDFLIEINLLKFINSFPKLFIKTSWKYNIENNFIFKFQLDDFQNELIDRSYRNMKENVRISNWNNWDNYNINWNLKERIFKNSSQVSWLNR